MSGRKRSCGFLPWRERDLLSKLALFRGVRQADLPLGRPAVRLWFPFMPQVPWVHRTRSGLWATRRDVIFHRQHHILNVAQVKFFRADGGFSRELQDFLGDELKGPIVFR